MDDIRLRLLGGFELSVNGEHVPLQPAARRLLAYVALAPHGVERLCAALQLWPDHSESRAKANLRSALWRLGGLDVSLICSVGGRLRLSPDVWLDTVDGLDPVGEDRIDVDGSVPFDTMMSGLLPDWYDDWLDIERERVRQLILTRLERRARNSLDGNDSATAIQWALTAVGIDPLRESARRLVIEAHLADGNTSNALREFDDYRTRLANEANLRPTVELLRLVRQNARQDDLEVVK
ncbi:MAG: BTAD domain-containing putative transcriptional regulator [Actinomycetota bacterium]